MALKMVFWDVAEVAKYLGTTPGNVRVLTHRGRLKIETLAGGKVYYDADLVREYGLRRRKKPKFPTLEGREKRRRERRRLP